MLTTTMVAVPGPTSYQEMMHHHHPHHHQQPQQQPLSSPPPLPQNEPCSPQHNHNSSSPTPTSTIPPQPCTANTAEAVTTGVDEDGCTAIITNEDCNQQPGIQNCSPPNSSSTSDSPQSTTHCSPHHSQPQPCTMPLQHHQPMQQPMVTMQPQQPPPPALMHQPPMGGPPSLTMALNHSNMNNTTLTSSTSIPVVTSTIDMSGQPHQFNQPPPYCHPEYYGGEYYHAPPPPPPEYCPANLCAVHGVPPGPATVRMVSTNSSPPIPLPVQVPAGHVVQQIVDENGTLQHVILSSQLPTMGLCYHGGNTGGSGAPQFYGPPPPPPHGGSGPPPPQGYVASYQPTPAQYSPVMTPPPLTQPSPPPHNYQKHDRPPRQYDKPRGGKYNRQQHYGGGRGSVHNTPPLSPKKVYVNKQLVVAAEEVAGMKGRPEEEQSPEEAQQEDLEVQLSSLLTQIAPIEVNNITPRSATLHWQAPPLHLLHEVPGAQEFLSSAELSYEVYLDRSLIHTVHHDLSTVIPGLRPGTEYSVQLLCVCGSVRARSYSTEQMFCTQSTVPERPAPPRLISKTKHSLHIKFISPRDGGSRVTAIFVELMDCGEETTAAAAALRAQASSERNVAGVWREVYRGRGRDCVINKLSPSTGFRVRIGAVNHIGPSEWSGELVCSTAGVPPSQPAPPTLAVAEVTSLTLSWPRLCPTHSYVLKMEDALTGYGFMPVYRGTDNKYCCKDLRRNNDYKFRLSAFNEEGESPFSDIVSYSTLPDRPGAPTPPTVKGRPRTHNLRLCWSPPSDHGGSYVTQYRLSIDKGNGFEVVYAGENCECDCHELQPGTSYHVRAQAVSAGGDGPWSAINTVTTDPVAPHQCLPPTLNAKPKSTMMQLKWAPVPCDGGSPVTEYNLEMVSPDSDRRLVYTGRETSCTVASLLPGRPYIFLLRAVNRVGPGQWSEPFEALSGAGPPEAPKSPHVACRNPHVVTAQWEEPINNGAKIDSYTVEVAEVNLSHAESSESSSTCEDSELTELTFSTATTTSSTQADVKHLIPDTKYAIRVCGVNSAGMGPFSGISIITTPPSAPCAPPHISSTTTCESVTLHWTEPKNNGDPIQQYIIEVMDVGVTHKTDGPMLEYTVNDLQPDTSYRVRVQAVNGVGVGNFSAPHKCQTRSLPPAPPAIELVKASYNFLKFSWGDKKQNLLSPEPLSYCLQMEFPNPHTNTKEFYQVYSGTGNTYKLSKLEEATVYRLRICATNQAGVGPNSEPQEFKTVRAPPPAPKAPRSSEQTATESSPGGILIEWCPVRCFNDDPVTYILQTRVATREHEYTTVYTGSSTSHLLRNLSPNSLYNVRVCGVRRCPDGEELMGAYSSPLVINTPKAPVQQKTSLSPAEVQQRTSIVQKLSWRRLSDAEKATVHVIAFFIFTAVLAYILSMLIY